MVFDERTPPFDSRLAKRMANKRTMFIMLASLACGLYAPDACQGSAPFDLRPADETAQARRVRVLLEVNGQLILRGEENQKTRLPLVVHGELLYDERLLPSEKQSVCRRYIRHYDTARAELRIGDIVQQPQLADEHRLAVVEVDGDEATLFSPHAPLTRDELDLLDIQANSALLARLLPDQPVAVEEKWPLDADWLAAMLCLDAVTQADVQGVLRQVENSVALIELDGSVSGAVRGVPSDIQLRGKCNFDLNARSITWLALSITEKRAGSHVDPGFEIVARLRMAMGPVPVRAELTDSAIQPLPLSTTTGTTLLALPATQGGFEFLHSRDWRVMADRHDVTILRLIQNGNLVAQCNTSRLADLPAGQQLQLEAFQADIQRALGQSFAEFVEASQETTPEGLRVLRVVASGLASEITIQWTYYHIADGQGRQVAMVFTMDSQLVEQFAGEDRTLVSTFRFTPAKEQAATAEPVSSTGAAETAAQPVRAGSGSRR